MVEFDLNQSKTLLSARILTAYYLQICFKVLSPFRLRARMSRRRILPFAPTVIFPWPIRISWRESRSSTAAYAQATTVYCKFVHVSAVVLESPSSHPIVINFNLLIPWRFNNNYCGSNSLLVAYQPISYCDSHHASRTFQTLVLSHSCVKSIQVKRVFP